MEEKILIERVLNATSSDEFYQPVSACRVRLSRKDIERILELAELAKVHKVASIRDWSYAVEWGFFDETAKSFCTDHAEASGEVFRSECDQVSVYASEFAESILFTAYEKHTEVRLISDHIDIKALREALAACKAA